MLHQEYHIGDFLRSFILSDEVDHDRIQAKLTNGVLRVELPRAPGPNHGVLKCPRDDLRREVAMRMTEQLPPF